MVEVIALVTGISKGKILALLYLQLRRFNGKILKVEYLWQESQQSEPLL
jgi:hypothetical protein